jgi:small-conductance mechanosensitive channel
MRRSLFILLGILLVGTAIVGLSALLAQRICLHRLAASGDELAWLRKEFHLSDAEMQRIRQLHDGYLPKCRENCSRIAAKKQELEAELDKAQGMTPEARQKLDEVAALRAQCQSSMLAHFYEVSRAMPPDQGRRYLAEMQRLTLGFHEQIENTMSGDTSSHHGHH